jgi:aspartate oxidase
MSDDRVGPTLKRRDFLKRGAAAGAGAVVGVSGGALAGPSAQNAQAGAVKWDRQVDVVVIGSGAAGMPAAIRAHDLKSSVVVIEENFDVGGHGIISQGSVALGGGHRLQKKYKIEDSADQIYLENTRPEHTHTRYADRKIVRAFADHNVEVFDFLEANGVIFIDAKPTAPPAPA